ncbi:MAG: SGNH/GDSL hydrolase family protein [Chloroflexi bacterium]|nr:SGNH/GDSL hydrolase family protein [Chloroflexota bacterium]
MAIIAAGRKIAFRSLFGNLAAFAAGLLVVVILAEVALRLLGVGHPYYSAPELYQPSPNPRLLFEPRPNFSGFSEGAAIQTNRLGLRERELPLAKPPGVVRVLFLGDSVTFGTGVGDEQPFPRLVESALADVGGGAVRTINAAVVGYNTTQELERLRAVGPAYRPDVVVLTFVVNDLLDAFSIFDHQYQPTGILAGPKVWLRRNSYLYRFTQNTYWRVAGELRRLGTGRTEPLRPRTRVEERLAELGEIAAWAQAHDARFLLVLYPDHIDDPVSPGAAGERVTVREELLGFAERSGVPAVDLTAALGDVRDPRARQFRLGEDPHPSPAGHRAIADALAPALRAVVAGLPAGR